MKRPDDPNKLAMSDNSDAPANDAHSGLLAPPVRPLLHFAARGWGAHNGVEPAAGTGRPPPRHWLPALIEGLADPAWLDRVRLHAVAGAEQAGSPQSLTDCVDRAFDTSRIAERLIKELAEETRRLFR